MRSLHLKYSILFFLIFAITELQSQEVISVSGGNVSSSEGSVSYSVGQVFYQIQSGSNGALSEGVQHPYTISTVQTTTGAEEIHLSVLAYPNPTPDILNLEVDNFGSGNMEYLVSDIQGKLLEHGRITGPKTRIEMAHLPPSTFIVNLVKDNQLVKSFKIIKK